MTSTTKKTILTAAGVLALGAGLGVAGLASADPTTPPSPSPSASSSATPGADQGHRGGGGRGGHGLRGDAVATELATKLGLDQTKVSDALKKVRQANKPTAKPTPGQTRPDPAAGDAALATALAPELGVDEATITTALNEIRAAHAADRSAALKARLDTAVKDGTLTQAEADAVQKAADTGVINVGPR